jgi:hypothetical protein
VSNGSNEGNDVTTSVCISSGLGDLIQVSQLLNQVNKAEATGRLDLSS